MMKLSTAILALSALFLPAFAQAQDFAPFVGGSPAVKESKALFEGKWVTIVRITAYYHQMNLPPHSAQPIGLEEFKFFIKDARGNMDRCEKWIQKVQADEAAWSKAKPTFPYLEINLADGARPVTVKGLTTYRGADARCWETMDFGPPLY
jgi:hypothetical protein